MKVADLAKELNTTSDAILETLKSLKMKAKNSKQELSSAATSVVKSEFKKGGKTAPGKKAVQEKPKITKKVTTTKKKEESKEKTKATKVKKTVKKETKPTKTAAKKVVKVVKKTVKKKKFVSKETLRAKRKISKEPVITLKPLARKRRKSSAAGKEDQKVGGLKDQELSTQLQEALGLEEQTPATTEAVTTPETAVVEERLAERDESLPDLEVKVPISVKDFSVKIQQKPSVVLKQLMKMGVMAHINQSLDGEVVSRLIKEFGFNFAKIKTQEEHLIAEHQEEEQNPDLLQLRAPVVTFMGHVDHGKTSLLDRIRKSKIADMEHGGITQHIGAYSVNLPKGRITFLDTPGHEAFTAMRARGAHITDLVVLVVAADEGVMPQTEEAIDHARAADVPIVVALNKIDRTNADPDRVKKELSERGLASEDWGGKTVVIGVSAMTGDGIDTLLEMILLEAELLELKANSEKKASGIVVEAHLSKGKGAVTSLIVQSGTLKEGDFFVVGPYYGKIRALLDDHERSIKEAGPSMPVEIMGLSDVPEAGELFYVVDGEKQAREISFKRQEQLKNKKLQSQQKITLEDLYSQIQEGSIKELNVIIKADVQGSLEALKDSLAKIPSDKVKIKFIHLGVGDVNASDVLLAIASKAIIIAFHVGIGPRAKTELEKEPVDIREYRIIYDAVDDIKKALEGLLEAKTKKNFLSRIEIREVFKLSKQGIVAGCYVTKGKVHRKAHVDIVRDDEVIFSGVLSSLKRFKDDVREVNEGMECGITVQDFTKYEAGDIIEAYEIESIAQKL